MTQSPRFLIHIGANKTGTSSIQSMLNANPSALKEGGWTYPDFHLDYFAHHKLAYSIRGHERGLPSGWADDIRQIISDPNKRFIISSELFFRIVDPRDVAEFFPPEQTKIVLYLRDHLSYMMSWYAQSVQERNLISSFSDFVHVFSQPYNSYLSRWDEVYGRDNVIVRPFDRKMLIGQDVRTDFLNEIDSIDPEKFNIPEAESNLSISGNLLFFKRILNNYMTYEEAHAFPIPDEFGAFADTKETFRGRFQASATDVGAVRHVFGHELKALQARGIEFDPLPKEVSGNPLPNFETVKEEFHFIKKIAVETDKRFLLYAERWQDWHSL